MSHLPISLFQIQKNIAEEQYWLSQLSGSLPETTIPFNGVRPHTMVKQTIDFILPENLTQQLIKVSKNNDLSLYILLLASVECVLFRYTGQKSSLVASPLYRPIADPDANNLIFIYDFFEPKDNFKKIVLSLKEKLIKNYENQDYPYTRIIKKLNITESHLPCTLGLLKNIHEIQLNNSITHDLTLVWEKTSNNEITYQIIYHSLLFSKAKIERFYQHWLTFLTVALSQPEVPIIHLNLLPTSELQQLAQFNQTALAYPTEQTIIELFEKQVIETPNNIAVTFREKQLTYRQLNEQANKVAYYLRQHHKAQSEECIAFWLVRSEVVLVAIWGILKAGSAYVPLDPGYPLDRVEHILQDSHCRIVLTDDFFAKKLAESTLLINSVDIHKIPTQTIENLPYIAKSHHLAYIIYTSGSTGKPKGVMIEHGSLVSLVSGLKEIIYRDLPHPLREALAAAFVFDLSVKQLFVTLVQGNTLCILDDDTRLDPRLFIDFLHQQQINFIDVSPAFFAAMLEYGLGENFPPNLHHIIVGSESVPPTLIYNFYQHEKCKKVTMTNMYGPTENCAEAAYFHVDAHFTTQATAVPIGRPIPNTQAFVIDNYSNLMPIGIPGEICISGPGLARGYANDATMTAAKFISHPFQANARLYRTGDVGYWSEAGQIEFLGRNDNQVKIRGFRVELGEIENRLLQHPRIKEAVVLAKDIDNNKELVAYVVGHVDINELRDHLKITFPTYMIPSYFVLLERLPLNISGKIDKKALPDPITDVATIDPNYKAPRNALEQQLVEIWQILLNKQAIGIQDNFFDIGGHSIKATQLVSKIHKALKIELSLRDIFTFPTIIELIEIIEAKKETFDVNHITAIPSAEYYDLSHAQRRLWLSSQLADTNTIYHIHEVIKLTGNLQVKFFQQAWEALVLRHESLRTTIVTVGGEPKQKIHPINQDCSLLFVDVSQLDKNILQKYIEKQVNTPFDLGKLPLVRVQLLKMAEQCYFFIFTMHHIIGDGWSIDILINELFKFYRQLCLGENINLPNLRIQYKEYAVWQKHLLNNQLGKELQQYWQQKLTAPLPILQLPTDFPRSVHKTYHCAHLISMMDSVTTEQLHKLATQYRISLFILLISLIRVLLYRYTEQEDIIIGTAVAGRNHPDLQEQIGFYVNMLPLRIIVKKEESFINVINTVKNVIFEAQEHQLYPFDKLVADVGGQWDRSRFPLFDVVVDLQDNQQLNGMLPEIELSAHDAQSDVSEYDLAFLFTMQNEQLLLNLTYNTSLFSNKTMNNLISHLDEIRKTVLTSSDVTLMNINLTNTVTSQPEEDIFTQFNF